MAWSRLIFRETIQVKTEYSQLLWLFKQKIDKNYFKGYIDNIQTRLFCYWPFSIQREDNRPLPVCEIYFVNQKDPHGNIVVHFKIVDALIVFCVLFLAAVIYAVYTIEELPAIFVVIVAAFLYLYLTVRYNVDRAGLMSDLDKFRQQYFPVDDTIEV